MQRFSGSRNRSPYPPPGSSRSSGGASEGGSPPFEFGGRRVDGCASVEAEGQVVEPAPVGRMQAENVVLRRRGAEILCVPVLSGRLESQALAVVVGVGRDRRRQQPHVADVLDLHDFLRVSSIFKSRRM